MNGLKGYFLKNFEQFFVLIILVVAVTITYFVDYKIAFLNFYFLPVILAGYYLGARKAVLGAVLSVAMITIYSLVYPTFLNFSNTPTEVMMSILLWGAFLILAGAVVGRQHESIRREVIMTKDLNEQLGQQNSQLNEAHTKLATYASDLESMVKERTFKLEQSKESIETLKQKVEDTLYKTMDRNVAKLIIDGRLRTEKRQITIMFADICSFTEYSSKQNPEVVVQQLNRFIQEMEAIILRYNGHIDKYLGDGIMVEFGAPLDFDRHAVLAVFAALQMQSVASRMDFPWRIRIGVASGMSILGMVGSKRQSYTSIGATVNLSSRIESVCPPGSVLIDRTAADAVAEFFHFKPFRLEAGVSLKGVTGAVELFEVIGRKSVFDGNSAFPVEMVQKYLPQVQNCGVPDELVWPVEALDATVGHGEKVAVLALALADKMGVDDHIKKEIAQAGFATDCGKAIIHHHILNRKGRLSDLEYEDVKRHPIESARVLRNHGFDSKTLHEIVLATHERMDGSGYPHGLKANEIPVAARIVAVADAYSSLTSYRPYREKWDPSAAVSELERAAEMGQLDASVVKHLRGLLMATRLAS